MSGYSHDVARKAEEHGYWLLPSRGSDTHEVWTNGERSQTVPRNLDSRDHANAILQQVGIKRALLVKNSRE